MKTNGRLHSLALILATLSLFLILVSTTASVADQCTWSGTWNTDYGTMKLTQVNNVVEGTYPDGMITKGTVYDSILTGDWENNEGDSGEIIFTMSEDCKSFDGEWTNAETGEKGDWSGTRR
jgi:hypothetical protein